MAVGPAAAAAAAELLLVERTAPTEEARARAALLLGEAAERTALPEEASAAQVPEGIKSWIKLRVGSLYAHREEIAVLSRGRVEALPFIDGLLDPYKVAFV